MQRKAISPHALSGSLLQDPEPNLQNLRQTSREATVLLYSPSLDSDLEKMTPLADRVFCFNDMPKAPARGRLKAETKMPVSQATLEASHEVVLETEG